MTALIYIQSIAAFLAATFGLGLPCARRIFADPAERLCAAAVLGLAFCFVIAWCAYLGGLALHWFMLAPIVGAWGLWDGREALRELWRDQFGRALVFAWAAVLLWIQALLIPIDSFSGAGWTVDWFEHHQRATVFREHWSPHFTLIGGYLLPARPPLVNVVVAGWQSITTTEFACDQVICGLWGSLAFLPAALLCRRLGGGAGVALLAGLLMLSPSFVQNATFPWTKLPTAFFVASGAYFLLRALDESGRRAPFVFAAIALSAGLLAHYSAGPYCVVFVTWWLGQRIREGRWDVLRAEALTGASVVLPFTGLWFGWAVRQFGIGNTLLSTSTATAAGAWTWSEQLAKIGSNLWSSVVPHPFRAVDYQFIAQPDPLAWFRDYFFLIAQVNLVALPGTGAGLALAVLAWRERRQWAATAVILTPARVGGALAAIVVLGISVIGARDSWGLAHICLVPLGILALAVLTAHIDRIGRVAAAVLAVGLVWDAAVNLGLHFALQWRPHPQAWLQVPDLRASFAQYGHAAYNAGLKHVAGLRFVADSLPLTARPTVALTLISASLCLWRSAWLRSNHRP